MRQWVRHLQCSDDMTTIAGPQHEPILSTKAPYAPIVMLIGGVLVLGVVIRLLNASPAAPDNPLSGAPVGDGPARVIVTQPAAGSATGSLSLVVGTASGEPIEVGPAAFPPGSAMALSVLLPNSEPTTISVTLTRLSDDGTLQSAEPISIPVTPDSDGMARVSTSVEALTTELGAGIYRLGLFWEGERIGGTDVALGQSQPSSIAIFSEPRVVSFAAGKHVGIRVNAAGETKNRKPYTLTKSSGAPAGAYAQFSGTPHVLVTEGLWAGYWIPLSDTVTLN